MMNDEQKQALIQCAIKFKSARNVYGSDIHEIRSLADFALAALTQSASPAFKLPDGWVAVPNEPNEDMLAAGSAVDGGVYSIWKDMVGASPDAPLTAPIEPICATGGAEWVKCSERMPEETEVFGGDDFSPEVLTINQYGEQWVGKTHWGKWVHTKHSDCIVLAWMPLPAAPEEK